MSNGNGSGLRDRFTFSGFTCSPLYLTPTNTHRAPAASWTLPRDAMRRMTAMN